MKKRAGYLVDGDDEEREEKKQDDLAREQYLYTEWRGTFPLSAKSGAVFFGAFTTIAANLAGYWNSAAR